MARAVYLGIFEIKSFKLAIKKLLLIIETQFNEREDQNPCTLVQVLIVYLRWFTLKTYKICH